MKLINMKVYFAKFVKCIFYTQFGLIIFNLMKFVWLSLVYYFITKLLLIT